MGIITSKPTKIDYRTYSPETRKVIADATERKLKVLEREGIRNVVFLREKYVRQGRIPPPADKPSSQEPATGSNEKSTFLIMDTNKPVDTKPSKTSKTEIATSISTASVKPSGEGTSTCSNIAIDTEPSTVAKQKLTRSNQTVVLLKNKSEISPGMDGSTASNIMVSNDLVVSNNFNNIHPKSSSSITIAASKSPAIHKISATIMMSGSHKSLRPGESFSSNKTINGPILEESKEM